MLKLEWSGPGRCLPLTTIIVLGAALFACGGSSSTPNDSNANNTSACLTCATNACPSQAAACDASPGCKTLRSCSLACQSGDAACRNACTAAAANDTTAILAGANYLACADVSCHNECSGSSGTGGMSGSGGQGGSTGTGGSGGMAGSGGSDGSSGSCGTARAKQTSCGLTPSSSCNNADLLTQCENNCIINNSCSIITAGEYGTSNAYSDCLDTCSITVETNNIFTVAAGGYVTAGAWKGYAWTATDGVSATTISPPDFSGLAAGGQLCVSGTVAGTSDYSGTAMLAISINQNSGNPAPAASTWTPSGAGITYSVTNSGGSPLRIQLQAAGGGTDATKRWCTPVKGNVGTPYWSVFNTKCWDLSGAGYDGLTPLESVMVLVPGSLTAVPFSFCVVALAPHP